MSLTVACAAAGVLAFALDALVSSWWHAPAYEDAILLMGLAPIGAPSTALLAVVMLHARAARA